MTECGINAIKLDQKGEETGCSGTVTMEQCNSFEVDVIVVSIDNKDVFRELKVHLQEETRLFGIDQFLEILE